MTLELLECENSILSECEYLKSKIFVISNGIMDISENRNLPILLNMLMDGINAYNDMISKHQSTKNNLLDPSFWSIELMDKIHATNGGNTTLLGYTLEKIQDQCPHILDVFDNINYVERISNNCKINEIYRGIMRLDFSLKIKTKYLINFIENKEKMNGVYYYDNLFNRIESLNQALRLLKHEFLYLIKDIIFFSKYLGIDGSLYKYDETVDKIEEIFELSNEKDEKVDCFLSELNIEEFDQVLKAFSSLNWIRGRLNIFSCKNLENEGGKLLATINEKK
ncbi:hypothetical protein RS030_182728 [Cryptosporidium xiaoi]|uniref:Uncharacterized protein n=1 Tax=Cryptosporidium xiaoi TaxID=659607 RepID=A0AAV9XZB3_9CRYT